MTQIEQRDPKTLRAHEYIRDFPRWPAGSEGFRGFCNDIREYGIQHPLQILADGTVLDGETRRLAALEVGLDAVPCVVVADDAAPTVILRELIQRRNLTQSAKAYWAYPTFSDAHEAARAYHRQRIGANLNRGQKRSTPDPYSPIAHSSALSGNIGEFAEFLGISRRLFEYAAKVHEIFDLDPSYKAQMLPEINEHGVGLGAVVAGWAGQRATKGKDRPDMPEDLRFKTTLRQLGIRVAKLPDVDVMRRAVQAVVREAKEDQLDSWFLLADELRVQLRTRMHGKKEAH